MLLLFLRVRVLGFYFGGGKVFGSFVARMELEDGRQ